MENFKKLSGATFFALALFFGFSFNAQAYRIDNLKDVPVSNDFVLGGGKVELFLNPGDNYTKELLITNRLGKPMNFKIELEDFTGSQNIEESIILLGGKKGPYSLKDYLKPEISEFVLEHGQRMVLPVEIFIPPNAEPGGLYGTVLVSAHPPLSEIGKEEDRAKGQIGIITRLGSLFFIRIMGEAKEEGLMKDFKALKDFYEKGPVFFQILFENNGNVHLAPSGIIEIRNIFGKKVDEIAVDRYFAMPDSIKFREIKWDKGMLFGRYTASIVLSRGYGDYNDKKDIIFWFLPWKILLAGFAVLFVVIGFFRWILRNFEFKRKT